jgi:hypothetical protein
MISSDKFGVLFATYVRDEAIMFALRRVTGAAGEEGTRANYERLYKKYNNI